MKNETNATISIVGIFQKNALKFHHILFFLENFIVQMKNADAMMFFVLAFDFFGGLDVHLLLIICN